MPRTPKLDDLQLILLATALKRENGSVMPLPDQIDPARLDKAVPPLLRRGLIEEVGTTDRKQRWREDGDQLFGLVITAAGRKAMSADAPEQKDPPAETPTTITLTGPRAGSKIETVFALLRRPQGATLTELIDATGWLPHTTRAALTGLRKKGHCLDKSSRDGKTCYRIARGRLMRPSVEQELAALTTCSSAQLAERWHEMTGAVVPRVSRRLLMLALAYELQVGAYGGLSRRAQQRLDQLAAAKTRTRDAQPGMRLAREWNGTVHVVTLDDAGTIRWNGKEWRSLSEVARAITGTRWSGPAFFGLKRKEVAMNKVRCAIYTRKSSEEGLEQGFQLARRPARGVRRLYPEPGQRRLGAGTRPI